MRDNNLMIIASWKEIVAGILLAPTYSYIMSKVIKKIIYYKIVIF